MTQSEILNFDLWVENQLNPHFPVNEALQILEFLLTLSVKSRTLNSPPNGAPSVAFYIPAAPATGVWSGKEGQLAFYSFTYEQWLFFAVPEGFKRFSLEDEADIYRTATGWEIAPSYLGYMDIATYDSNGDGIVNAATEAFTAENAEFANVAGSLNSIASEFYLDRANHTGTQSVTSLNISGNSKYVGTDSAGNKGFFDLPQQLSPETGATIKGKLEALTGTSRLEASAIQNLPTGSTETGLSIVSKLEALTGTDRLNASAIEGAIGGNIAVFNEGVQIAPSINAIDFVGNNVNITFNNGLWTPSDLGSTVQFWLDANNGFVDRSPNNRPVLNSANRGSILAATLNNNAIFRFNNAQGLAFANAYDPSNATVFAVIRDDNSDQRVVSVTNNNNATGLRNFFDLNPLRFRLNPSSTNQDTSYNGTTIANNTWHLLEFRGSNLTWYNNGVQLTTTIANAAVQTVNSLANSNIVINAAYYNSSTNTFSVFSGGTNNDIAEIIVIDKTLSVAVHEQVEGYLAHKYGLTANLPTNHPYKNAAPTSTSVQRAIVTVSPILAPVQTTNFVALPNRIYPIGSSGGAITTILSATTNWEKGNTVTFVDRAGTFGNNSTGFGLNNLTITANSGQNIAGNSSITLNQSCQSITLQYADNGRFDLVAAI